MNIVSELHKHRRQADTLAHEHAQATADAEQATGEKIEQAADRAERDPQVLKLRGALDKIRRCISAAERSTRDPDTGPAAGLLAAIGTGDREAISTARRMLREQLATAAENAALILAGADAIGKLQYDIDRALVLARRNAGG